MKKLVYYSLAFALYSSHAFAETEKSPTTATPLSESTKAQHSSAATTDTPTPRELKATAIFAEPTEAQPKLPTTTLKIGSATVTAEIAADDNSRIMGLMFRKGLDKDHGMLFVMPRVGPVGFWMKNTFIPLSIAFIDAHGRIMEIHDLEPFNEKTVRSQFSNIAYALEMSRGWFSDNAVFPGTTISGLPERRLTY